MYYIGRCCGPVRITGSQPPVIISLDCMRFVMCAISSLTHRQKERDGEITQTVSSWFILASHAGQFIKLLHSDAPTNPHTGQPTRIHPASSGLIVCVNVCVGVPVCVSIFIFVRVFYFPLCAYLIGSFVCIIYVLYLYGFCVCMHTVCVFSCLCEPVCACLHVVFEMCRGGCLSLCICQSFCLDSQSTKPRREEWERRRRERDG